MRQQKKTDRQLLSANTTSAHQQRLLQIKNYLTEHFPDLLDFSMTTWQNEPGALEWFANPHSELGRKTPISLLRTPEGVSQVRYVLAALEYGFPI